MPIFALVGSAHPTQYCSDQQKLETRFLKETGFLATQLFLTEQYCHPTLIENGARYQVINPFNQSDLTSSILPLDPRRLKVNRQLGNDNSVITVVIAFLCKLIYM